MYSYYSTGSQDMKTILRGSSWPIMFAFETYYIITQQLPCYIIYLSCVSNIGLHFINSTCIQEHFFNFLDIISINPALIDILTDVPHLKLVAWANLSFNLLFSLNIINSDTGNNYLMQATGTLFIGYALWLTTPIISIPAAAMAMVYVILYIAYKSVACPYVAPPTEETIKKRPLYHWVCAYDLAHYVLLCAYLWRRYTQGIL